MKAEILKLEEELRLAMISGDVVKLDELISDNLVFVGPDGTVVSKDMDLSAHKSGIQKITELTPSEQTVDLYDNFVVVTVKMGLIGMYHDFSISGKYRYLRVWSKINDRIQVVAGSVTKIVG